VSDVPHFVIERYREKSSDYCLIAIVWNEGDRIRRQIERMAAWSSEVDLIIVDGGSDDGSLEKDHLFDHGISALVSVNERGLGTGVRAAISYALEDGYLGLITVDGNGKDDLSGLPGFIEGLREGYGLVQGSRFMRGGTHRRTPMERLIGIKWVVAPLMSLFAKTWVTDPTNGFRGLSREYLIDPRLQPLRGQFVGFNLQLYLVYRAGKLGYGLKEVPVGRAYPEDGSVPTKILGWKPRLRFFRELFRVLLGFDNPKA
jgi:dolichol-phosphate mannosyltransferase